MLIRTNKMARIIIKEARRAKTPYSSVIWREICTFNAGLSILNNGDVVITAPVHIIKKLKNDHIKED
jgi:hypothetical protein